MRLLSKRQSKTLRLVAKGLPVRTAMLKAGYPPSTSQLCGKHSPRLKEKIKYAQEKYMSAFTSLVNKEIPAKSTVKRLKKVIDGKDDFNAVNAIKEVNRNMFRHSSELNQSINVENGVFIVPTKSSDGNWEERARKLEQKVIDVKPENEC